MADYRNDEDRTLPGGPGMNATPEKDPEHLLPDHTHAAPLGTIGAQVVPDDPAAVRSEIERTRQRMSSTIDQLEVALQRKKAEVQDRLDFAAPVRERPWAFAAGVFGTGLALGYLTGGGRGRDDDYDPDHVKVPRALLEGIGLEPVDGSFAGNGRASGDWENRARELMQVVARQEEEIRDLRAVVYGREEGADGLAEAELDAPESLGEVEVQDEWNEEWNFDDEGDDFQDFEALGLPEERGRFSVSKPVAGLVSAGVAALVGTLAKKLVADRFGGMDVEVDLEPRHGASVVDDRAGRYTASGVADAREALATPASPTTTGTAETTGATAGTRTHGEMDVEVELEREPRSPYTNRPPQYGRPMDVEVELETPVRRPVRRSRRVHAPEMSPLAGAVAVGAAVAISGLVARLLQSRRGGMDVEVELEERGGYRPSVQPRTAHAAPGSSGEMEVEVDLESRAAATPARPHTPEQPHEAHQPHGVQQPHGAHQPKTPHQPLAGHQGGMDVEVELEPRTTGSQGYVDTDPDGGRGASPQSPPLM